MSEMARNIARGIPEERPGQTARGAEESGRAVNLSNGSTPEQIESESEKLRSSGMLSPLLDLIPAMIVIMNRQRQILYIKAPGLSAAGGKSTAECLGLRLGEVFQCIHASESPDGCGGCEHCALCGASFAAQAATDAKGGIFDCQILQRGTPDTVDFRLYTTGVEFGGKIYIFCVGVDIRSQIRQRALERIFFHDLLNVTGNIDGLAWLLVQSVEKSEHERCRLLLANACRRLSDEIRTHRDIFDAERGELETEMQALEPWEFLLGLVEHYRYHPVGRTRELRLITPPEPLPTLQLDAPLLGRVLGNLIKNALEATCRGQTVEISARACHESRVVQFLVWNPEPIPCELQKRIFTRAFSTKGAGRGLGTYGAKLIAERYLGGSLTFCSNLSEGTNFCLSLPVTPPRRSCDKALPNQPQPAPA